MGLRVLKRNFGNTQTHKHKHAFLRHCRIHFIPVDCAVAICVKHVESSGKLFERQHTIYDILKSQSDSPFS